MFIISEISPQFGNDLAVAEQMILQSKFGGAAAVKVQLYPAEMFFPARVDEYVKSRELTFEDFRRLVKYGETIGIPVFATAFDEERLQWCIDVNQKYYKVAARQHAENPDLVDAIVELGKPTFVSVPAGQDPQAIEPKEHCTYLHCVSNYPTLLEDVVIPDFRNSIFSGISDHSLGIAAALTAAAHGATHLEKHFTLAHSGQRSVEKGHLGAMTVEELRTIAAVSLDMERIPTAK